MDNIATSEGSFIVMLSAELIEQIAQVHFNKVMFKQQVQIVDSKATEAGYAFTLTLTDIKKQTVKSRRIFPPAVDDTVHQMLADTAPVSYSYREGVEAPPGDTVGIGYEDYLASKNNGIPQRDSKGRFAKHAHS